MRIRAQVAYNNKLSDPFEIRTGVRKGCLLHPLLFLVVIDYITREVVKNERNGIQWTFTEQLGDLDFADVCSISAAHNQMKRKTEKLSVNASKLGINVNIPKIKVLKVDAKVNSPISLGGEDIEYVEEFCYLGSVISTDRGTDKDISVRTGKNRYAFRALQTSVVRVLSDMAI